MPLAPIQPHGTFTVSGEELRSLRKAIRLFEAMAAGIECIDILPSTLVSYESKKTLLQSNADERVRLIDRQSGDTISLRADFTSQIVSTAAGQKATYAAHGPVFREGSGQMREIYQASLEMLRQDPQSSLQVVFAFALFFAQACLPEYSVFLGNTAKHPEDSVHSRRGYQSSLKNWLGDSSESAPEFLHVWQDLGLQIPNLYVNHEFLAPRSYYDGWYFQIFGPEGTNAVVSGGQYRDPRDRDVLHAGCGIHLTTLCRSGQSEVQTVADEKVEAFAAWAKERM
jgi:ATP phosphoribosyltransferase regulatory subunit HisZ